MNIIGKRNINLTISIILVLASWIAVGVFGLRLGRDFTGGSLMEIRASSNALDRQAVEDAVNKERAEDTQVTVSQNGSFFIRMKPITEEEHQTVLSAIRQAALSRQSDASIEEVRFESIGPTVGKELRDKAIKAIIITLCAIIAYITWAFRKVSKPVSSWKYGVTAVLALVHDVSIPTGVFAVLGKFAGYEVDALFVTALLTVLGFSVHDTIVVFDRIRENLIKRGGKDYEATTNQSVNETLARSINTSLTTLLVLVCLYILGGDTTSRFVLVLIIGIFFGTYSSIFVASPLLVIWNNLSSKK